MNQTKLALAPLGCLALPLRQRLSSVRAEDDSLYYGSYDGDRFRGGIGNRVGVDESSKRRLPGTCVDRVVLFSERHRALAAWATEENWREATRIHKAAYFTRTQNLVQEEVLQKVRKHYVESRGDDDRLVQAGLFRCDDIPAFKAVCASSTVRRIPSVVHGVFDEKGERCVVDFANKRLGGGWLSYGMVQEEKMFIERFDFGALCARSLLNMDDPVANPIASPFSMRPNEAWILRGAPAFAEVQWYGRTPKDGLERVRLLDPMDDRHTTPTVVAIDAIKANFTHYRREYLEMMLLKAYVGLAAAKADEDLGGEALIATGSWGCGAFYNNECVMFVVQALAANAAGVSLTHHVLGDGIRLDRAFAFMEDQVLKKRTVAESLDLLVDLCAKDPHWKSKFDPEKQRRWEEEQKKRKESKL